MKKELVDQMTVQQACDYAIDKLVEQGTVCLRSSGVCAYENKKGHHCAIGWLLDEDDLELMDAEGGIKALIGYKGECIPNLIIDNIEIFQTFQLFHDKRNQEGKVVIKDELQILGIDTDTNPNYQKWVEMGN